MPEPERIDKRSLRYAGRREELLDALTRYVIDNGVGELTVRQLAKAVGVSHASLLNHFESKENLLSEVIENMRGESIPIAVPMKPGVDPAAVLTAWWTERTTPEVLPRFRVMVEIYALALGDRERYGRFLDRFVGDWIEALEAGLRQAGCPEDDVASVATLLLSQMRGLSIDLRPLGTVESRVDRAFGLFVDGFAARAQEWSTPGSDRLHPDRSPRSRRSHCRLPLGVRNPPRVNVSTVISTCSVLVSTRRQPPGRSHGAASAMMRRCRSSPSVPPSNETSGS